MGIVRDPASRDRHKAFVEIREIVEGREAFSLVLKLVRMYSRYAESQGWTLKPISGTGAPPDCWSKRCLLVMGDDAYDRLKYETGIHRFQWTPPTEQQGRVATSKLLVAVTQHPDKLDLVNGSFDGIIRTYNFPLNRVRDHRLGLSFGLAPVLDGGLDSIVEALLVRGSDIGES